MKLFFPKNPSCGLCEFELMSWDCSALVFREFPVGVDFSTACCAYLAEAEHLGSCAEHS